MSAARILVCGLLLSIPPLLAGCSRAPVKELEELETEEVRNERRMKHQKATVPANTPGTTPAPK